MTETSRSGPVAHDHRAMRPGGCSEAGKRSFPTVPEKSGGDEVVGGGLDAIKVHRLTLAPMPIALSAATRLCSQLIQPTSNEVGSWSVSNV